MRTSEQAEERQEWIQQEALVVLKAIVDEAAWAYMPGVMMRARKWRERVRDWERTDRCWYCFKSEAQGADLGVETSTGLCCCLNCHLRIYTQQHNIGLDPIDRSVHVPPSKRR